MNKKRLQAAALALAAAQYCATAAAENPRLLTQPGWELGIHASRYKYEEPGLRSLEGYRGGASGAFTITTRSRVFLRLDLRGTTSTGAAGYERAARYAYLPIGATVRLGLGERWALASTLEYDVFLRGRQQSELGDTGIPGLEDATNTQTRGRGYRASLTIEADDWSFGPWVQYWHIRDSLLVTAGSVIGMEPENQTREVGLELRWRF